MYNATCEGGIIDNSKHMLTLAEYDSLWEQRRIEWNNNLTITHYMVTNVKSNILNWKYLSIA